MGLTCDYWILNDSHGYFRRWGGHPDFNTKISWENLGFLYFNKHPCWCTDELVKLTWAKLHGWKIHQK